MSIDRTILPFKNQDYYQLKEQYTSSYLFEDPEFPATNRSLFASRAPPAGIKWKRPHEVRSDAQFAVGEFDRRDFDQGYLGNCWFIAGCVGIMQNKKLFEKVVPKRQSFTEDYTGLFHFRFWFQGEWVDVCVDDRLPFWSDNRLVFCSNKQEPNEFWAALLEKAYAKLNGSYENLDGGFTTDALIDMSGGIEETHSLKSLNFKQRDELWTILKQAYEKESIIGCSIEADPRTREARMSNGLVKGHAYTVTALGSVTLHGRQVKLLRCRNPWGNEVEWKGAFSDSSREWNFISADEKDTLGVSKADDGEFWMSFDDFITNWDSVEICHLTAESFADELRETDQDNDIAWHCAMHHDEWKKYESAGGCGNGNPNKFWKNPQFIVKLVDVDKDDNENMTTMVLALMQKDSRLRRLQNGGESAEEFIQFRVFKVKEGIADKSLGMKYYASELERIGTSGNYVNKREVTKRFRVSPGTYVIIPSTYDENKESKFLLRVFTEKVIEAENLNVDKDELDDSDIFFDNSDEDALFNDWNNLIGGNIGGNTDEENGNGGSSSSNVKPEDCLIM